MSGVRYPSGNSLVDIFILAEFVEKERTMLETILNNFHLEKILWILQKRIAYIMILGVLGGMAGGAYAYLTNSTLYRAEVSFYVYSDPDYVYDSSVNISNSEFTQAKNLVQS